MIKIEPFENMSYCELRSNYLLRIAKSGAVAFDEADILGKEEKIRGQKTEETFQLLMKSGEEYRGLREFLFPDDVINREHLQFLLAGPPNPPRSVGGYGSYASFRQFFENMIQQIGVLEEHKDKPVCRKIFKYGALRTVKRDWEDSLAYWLQQQLDVRVCPYCNRMYTTTLTEKNKIRPEFDHFYPKSKYPYLEVNLFNLIPSCGICNNKKRDNAEIYCEHGDNTSIIYPYDESFDEFRNHTSFRLVPDCGKAVEVLTGKSDMFVVELHPRTNSDYFEFKHNGGVLVQTERTVRFRKECHCVLADDEKEKTRAESMYWDRVKNSIDLLQFEELYNEHKKEVMALVRNHYQYNQNSIKLIMKNYFKTKYPNATEREVGLLAGDMLYFAFLQKEEWGISPLNKLKHDILMQLDEIEDTQVDEQMIGGCK